MRELDVRMITEAVASLCIQANHRLEESTKECISRCAAEEPWAPAKAVLDIIEENIAIAEEGEFPLCQDTGMACVFIDLGQDVHLVGGLLEDAVNEGVRRGYGEGYLRKSIVADPLRRTNTGDNTPADLVVRIVSGDQVKITVAPENSYLIEARMIGGRRYLLIPADDGVEVNGVSVSIPNEEHS